MPTERDFLRGLQQRFPARPPVEVGIGDDGAVIRPLADSRTVIVTDMLLDGVHFDLDQTTPELVGRKAVAVNLSDLAAMGCRPVAGFVSLALAKSRLRQTPDFLNRLYRGIEDIANEFSFTLAGGDSNSWNGPFAINVCLTGEPFTERIPLRSDARPGDHLFVTGPLGGSLSSGRHLTFTPRLRESEWLLNQFRIGAMMDISDGLAIDLHRLCEASGVGATIEADAIPIHDDVASFDVSQSAASARFAPSDEIPQHLSHALSDGEDFELLFSLSEAESLRLSSRKQPLPFTLYRIGHVEVETGCRLQVLDGRSMTLEPAGWQHSLS